MGKTFSFFKRLKLKVKNYQRTMFKSDTIALYFISTVCLWAGSDLLLSVKAQNSCFRVTKFNSLERTCAKTTENCVKYSDWSVHEDAFSCCKQSFNDGCTAMLTSLSGSGHDGSSLANSLNFIYPDYNSAYFLTTPFTISYDFTQRVDYVDGNPVVRDTDYLIAEAGALDPNWATEVANHGGNVAEAYHSINGLYWEVYSLSVLSHIYGTTYTDLTKVPLVYSDPEHYMLQLNLDTEVPVRFMGSDMVDQPTVQWKLTYCHTPGDFGTAYSDILRGTQIGDTLKISAMPDSAGLIRAVEYPVSGFMGTFAGFFISDITELTVA